MQYSLVKNFRAPPAPKLKGSCPACGAPTTSKCGPQVIWHWAHAGRLHCDPWWENETPWHRAWKDCFAEDQREVVRFDDTGEKHIADVLTRNGMVIEFQNSPMSLNELVSREAFYRKMLWIVNAQAFAKQFFIMSPVPDPRSRLGQDIVLFPQSPKPSARVKPGALSGLMFWLRSENVGHTGMVLIPETRKFYEEILSSYSGHHLFHWIRPREVWFHATAPVFLDFGDDALWWLQARSNGSEARTVRRVSKVALINKNGGNANAAVVGNGATPIHPEVAPEEIRELWSRLE